MTLSPSPATAARKFAAKYPRFAGVVVVQSMTPAGKGGWSIKAKNTPFFCRDGRARQTVLRRPAGWRQGEGWRFSTRNGLCPVCGKVYLEPIISYCKDPDSIGLMACLGCRQLRRLQPFAIGEYLSGAVSTLAVHDPDRVDLVLDIRSVQSQLAESPDIIPSLHFLPQWSALNA